MARTICGVASPEEAARDRSTGPLLFSGPSSWACSAGSCIHSSYPPSDDDRVDDPLAAAAAITSHGEAEAAAAAVVDMARMIHRRLTTINHPGNRTRQLRKHNMPRPAVNNSSSSHKAGDRASGQVPSVVLRPGIWPGIEDATRGLIPRIKAVAAGVGSEEGPVLVGAM